MFGLNKEELAVLKRLSTPQKIQDFLDALPQNYEKDGDTLYSPRSVLHEQKAHCIEGALLAATALWLQGKRPLILDLKAHDADYDHVVALYKQNGHWGAISKTNHAVLRFRDPVYRTVRELALSYFHEYFLVTNGRKTLQSYSRPVSLAPLGTAWVTAEDHLWDIGNMLYDIKHYPLVPKGSERMIRKASKIECRAGGIPEWVKNDPRT